MDWLNHIKPTFLFRMKVVSFDLAYVTSEMMFFILVVNEAKLN